MSFSGAAWTGFRSTTWTPSPDSWNARETLDSNNWKEFKLYFHHKDIWEEAKARIFLPRIYICRPRPAATQSQSLVDKRTSSSSHFDFPSSCSCHWSRLSWENICQLRVDIAGLWTCLCIGTGSSQRKSRRSSTLDCIALKFSIFKWVFKDNKRISTHVHNENSAEQIWWLKSISRSDSEDSWSSLKTWI